MAAWLVSGSFSCNVLFGISWVGLEGLNSVGDATGKSGLDGGEGSMVGVLGKEPNDVEVAVSNETGVRICGIPH